MDGEDKELGEGEGVLVSRDREVGGWMIKEREGVGR